MICPQCGSANVDRDEVDVGVGTQTGPYKCYDCGWTQYEVFLDPLPIQLNDLNLAVRRSAISSLSRSCQFLQSVRPDLTIEEVEMVRELGRRLSNI
jgi:hypothetical protein